MFYLYNPHICYSNAPGILFSNNAQPAPPSTRTTKLDSMAEGGGRRGVQEQGRCDHQTSNMDMLSRLCKLGTRRASGPEVCEALRIRGVDCLATMLTTRSFQYIIRLLNTNVDGKQKVMYAMTRIKGVGRRYSNLVCKKADVDLSKRAGDLTSEELERIVTILQNPLQCTFTTINVA